MNHSTDVQAVIKCPKEKVCQQHSKFLLMNRDEDAEAMPEDIEDNLVHMVCQEKACSVNRRILEIALRKLTEEHR